MNYRIVAVCMFFSLIAIQVIGQTGGVKGRIVDAKTQEPLIGATVMLNHTQPAPLK